jgi:hypothetical protein
MRHRILLVVALLLGCGRGHAATVANGGFEDGLDGWTADGGVASVDGLAHSGTKCAGGGVDVRGWTLSQTKFGTEKGKTYRIDAWLRAKGDAVVALWTHEESKGPKTEQRVAVWDTVGDAWSPVSAYVSAQCADKMTMRFAASAAKAGAKATVWIDDVSIREASPPVATQVDPGKGFDDEPSMARAADGTYYVAWVSWRDGAETFQCARFRIGQAGALDKLNAYRVDGPPDVLAPKLLIDGGKVLARYGVETANGWHPHSMGLGEERAGVRSVRTDLYVRPMYQSSAIVGADGFVKSVFRDRIGDNWLLLWGTKSADEQMIGINGQFKSATPLRWPLLLAHGADTWLIYEDVETPGYQVNYETAHHVVVAKIDGDHLLAPKNYIATSPLWDRAQSPAAAFDDKGRLWIAYLKPRLPTAGWEVWLTGWTGAAWIAPIPVSSMKGMNRRPSLVLDGNRAVICFQADDLPEGWGDIAKAATAKSGVYLTSIELPDVPAATPQLEPLVENPAKWEAAEIRHRFGDDAPTKHTTTVGSETLTLLYGDLHAHSDTSVCQRLYNGSADDVYAMQRDFLHLDFACITDHGEDFNPYLWNRQAKLARANDVPGKFTTFLGEEWASSFQEPKYRSPAHPYGYYGHRNIVLADLRFPRWWNPQNGQTPAEVWADLRAAKANFIMIPHQLADHGTNIPMDWSFVDEVAQPVAEVFQIRGSYEAKGAPRVAKDGTPEESYYLQGALKQGVVVGVMASPDHGGGVGKACVWAKENSREAILDAFRARRCFGTTGARIALEVRVDGRFMGEKTSEHADASPVTIEVKATCPNDVAKVSICRGGEWIDAQTPTSRAFDVRFVDEHPPAGPKWYYVRVEQADGEIAWSSPVWLGTR